MSHHIMPYKYGGRTREFLGAFYFHFSLVFHDFEEILENNYSNRACWIWDDYSQLGATPLVAYLSSHIQRALVE